MDTSKLERLIKQVVANDGIMLDAVTIGGMLNESKWFDPDSQQWGLALKGLSSMPDAEEAAIMLVDIVLPKANIYYERLPKRSGLDGKMLWGCTIVPTCRPTIARGKAYASRQGRATVLALMQVLVGNNN